MNTSRRLSLAILSWAGLAALVSHGAVPSQVQAWHKAGQRGKGVKVAILDSGFKGYKAALGKVLPARVTVASFRKDGKLEARESQHGILCAEIIHRLAPEAQLLFANWEPESPAAFLRAVAWARSQGARVISCSMIMPSWSDGEGGGPIHARLKALLGKDALFFASAGNTALRHWGGTFAPNGEGWHQWAPGLAVNTIRPTSTGRVSVELVHKEGTFELIVEDARTGDELGRSRTVGTSAVVRVIPKEKTKLAVRVRRLGVVDASKGSPRFHLTILGGKLGIAARAGSIPFPGDGAHVVAVGAVTASGRRMTYSSCGPLSSGQKPDLCAVVPVPSVWRPEQPFAGTSAAAPQAAGLAALLMGANILDVRTTMKKAANRTKPGHCTEAGWGMANLPTTK